LKKFNILDLNPKHLNQIQKKKTLFCRISYSTLHFDPVHLGSPTHLSLEFFRAGPAHNNIPAQATPPRFTAAAAPRRAAAPCAAMGCPPMLGGTGGEAPPVPPLFPSSSGA
jgi:hypothetical protein